MSTKTDMKMKSSLFLNVVLAAALLCVSVRLATVSEEKAVEKTGGTSAEVYQNIMTRSSVREYLDTSISDSQIDTLLHAGMAAPTAMNRQPWHLVVVRDRSLLQQIAGLCPNASMAKDAPLAIVPCGDMSKYEEDEDGLRGFWPQDLSAVTENILLQAHAMGLGAVWTVTYPSVER